MTRGREVLTRPWRHRAPALEPEAEDRGAGVAQVGGRWGARRTPLVGCTGLVRRRR